ncbi:hypothetical protein DTO212C5_4936 [Paecilomyces variotii]|nr:hypothetical protein DTO212C5_4936 [Paecilomyces variotii]
MSDNVAYDGIDQEKGKPDVEAEETVSIYGSRPKCFSNTLQECLFVLTATMAIGQSSMFQGSVVGVTASIGRDLNMNSAEITWISSGSALSSGAFLLTFGKLADMFGRKSMFTAGMAGFTLSLLIAGFANNAIYMDVFSGVMGLFSAAVVPPAVGILGSVYEKPSKRKNLAFACFSAGNPLGFVAGIIISGVADHLYNWRASLWTLAVIYAIFTVFTIWTVPHDGHDRLPLAWRSFKKFDLLGTFLVITGIACFSSALTLAGDAPDGWRTGYVIALLVVGIFLVGLFLYWESLCAFPLMPLYVWRNREFSLLMLIFCLGFMGFASVTFWISLYMQELKHLSALLVAVQLLPMVVSGTLVNVVCGFVLHKVSNKLLMGIGAVGYTAALLILSFLREDAPYWAFIFPGLILVVVGADIEFNVVNMYVMSSLPSSEQSVAGGIFNTISKLCNNISLGISTAVYNAVRAQQSSTSIRPYLATFWFGAAISGISIFLVPFLRLGTQGGKESHHRPIEKSSTEKNTAEEKIREVIPGSDESSFSRQGEISVIGAEK